MKTWIVSAFVIMSGSAIASLELSVNYNYIGEAFNSQKPEDRVSYIGFRNDSPKCALVKFNKNPRTGRDEAILTHEQSWTSWFNPFILDSKIVISEDSTPTYTLRWSMTTITGTVKGTSFVDNLRPFSEIHLSIPYTATFNPGNIEQGRDQVSITHVLRISNCK